ncbi:high molecular weight rhoptry protein-2 [Plasmodium cynomolgi strain B]|uniref:High molecular weight rhoptry protein-2 n=1 Tax=Plasmodium cynomolgi (strain B) TaxID=1120755 RepID=K6UD26_PLACD|nr:high molecular weight rhoptry protein-2 [Plasmodium cynomolgi strain B]GAB65866.1 high molecular weight rhoptry protein-2 [Plasmodium cynomolgi strain B]
MRLPLLLSPLTLLWCARGGSALELSHSLSIKNAPDASALNIEVEKDKKKICKNAFLYINVAELLSQNDEESYVQKCEELMDTIKNDTPDETAEAEINEFILSLLHTRSNYSIINEADEQVLKNLLRSVNGSISEEAALKRAKELIVFNRFIKDKAKVKNVQEMFVLSSKADEYMNDAKTKMIENIVDSFQLFHNYLVTWGSDIKVVKRYATETFLSIKNEKICSDYIHLCQKFYEQASIYYRLKVIFDNLVTYVDQNSKHFKKDKLLELLDMDKGFYRESKVHNNYVLEDETVIPVLQLTDIYKGHKWVVRVVHDGNSKLMHGNDIEDKEVRQKFIVTMKNIRRDLNDEGLYSDLMKTVKNYVLSITQVDNDISNLVRELDHEDVEKCKAGAAYGLHYERLLIDLNFFLYYGFLKIEEDKNMITFNDVSPTFINLYRANHILFLYLLKTGFEENKNSEYLAFKFYKNIGYKKIPNDKIYSLFTGKGSLTNLPKPSPEVMKEHFLSIFPSLPDNYDASAKEIQKFHLFFAMAFKDCNINQGYSAISKELWSELLYAFDHFGWFYVHPQNIISSLSKTSFVRQMLISRNFILKNNEALILLDTQVAKLMDLIHLSMETDKSRHALDFSISSKFFHYENDYNTLKENDKKRLMFTYDYIDSIANNYYFFSDVKYQVFKSTYESRFFTTFPNVYSLAYQLFNELAINMNVVTNAPLKKKLKDKSKYAWFTLLNIIGKNHDIYSKGPRLVFAAYMLALVYFIESHIDISRYQPKEYYFMKQSLPLIDNVHKNGFTMLKKRCDMLVNFIKINKTPLKYQQTNMEEYIKLMNLTAIVLWGKESKKSVFYDDDVSLYKKLMIACVFNGGKTVQEKAIESINKSCDVKFYGLNPKKLDEFIDINMSINKWNPLILEKQAQSFILSCKTQKLMYNNINVEKIKLENFYKLADAPEMIKTYHCFKLGRQAASLLESIILKKKFVRFRVSDAMDVYDFFYINKVLSNNVRNDFEEFLKNKQAYEKAQNEIIITNSPLGAEKTKKLIDEHQCYWFSSYDNFKILWMHVSSNMGTGTYLKNFFSEIWQNLHFLFKKKATVKDVEFFAGDLSQQELIDYYSPLVHSESHCQEKMQSLFVSLRDNDEQNRVEIPDKIKTAYFQCKLDYYKNYHTDKTHLIKSRDFLDNRVYVLKQPYYLISNIDNTHKNKLLRLFVTESTLDYLLLDNIDIPECFGRCTIDHFNRVVLQQGKTNQHDEVIQNALVPENTASKKRKEMTVYVNNIYVHNLKTDYITKEEITRKDIEENKVKVCLGMGTYFMKNFLTEQHFNLSYKPVLDFNAEHNFKVFLKKNESQLSKNENDICYVNYDLAITNIEITDPYREISENLIKNLYILKNK